MRRAILGSAAFFVLAPGVVAGWIPYTLTRWRIAEPLLGLSLVRWLGGVLLLPSVGALVECFARFALEGRGTPAPPAPTESLVVTGLYRHVRNPMYLAVVGAIVGQALLFGRSVLLEYAGAVWLFFHVFVLAYEEPTLSTRFGESYRTYRHAVRRWLPRITPWRGEARKGGAA